MRRRRSRIPRLRKPSQSSSITTLIKSDLTVIAATSATYFNFFFHYPHYLWTGGAISAPGTLQANYARLRGVFDSYRVNSLTVNWLPYITNQGVGTAAFYLIQTAIDRDDYSETGGLAGGLNDPSSREHILFRQFTRRMKASDTPFRRYMNCDAYIPVPSASASSNYNMVPADSYGTLKVIIGDIANAQVATGAVIGRLQGQWSVTFKGYQTSLT